MPYRKKTQTTNKKGNKKKQNQKKMKEQQALKEEQEFNKRNGWKNDNEIDDNYKFAKQVTIKLFHYHKKNMIIGDIEDVKTKRFLQKLFRKNPEALCGTLTFEGKKYVCLQEDMEEWYEQLNEVLRGHNGNEQQAKDIHTIMTQMLFNHPKPNGEMNNWNIGFMGSIWIDCKVETRMYRLALYNKGRKDFSIKEYEPSLLIMDMNEEGCRDNCSFFIGDGIERRVGGGNVDSDSE